MYEFQATHKLIYQKEISFDSIKTSFMIKTKFRRIIFKTLYFTGFVRDNEKAKIQTRKSKAESKAKGEAKC